MRFVRRIKTLVSRRRHPRMVREILASLVSTDTLAELAGTPDEELILDCALAEKLAPQQLLAAVAAKLGVFPLPELEPVSSELIQTIGLPEDTYRDTHAAPQWSPTVVGAYGIAFARPDLIDIGAFREAGLPVWLTFGQSVERYWRNEEKPVAQKGTASISLAASQVWAGMRRLAGEAAGLGARELFVGHPAMDRYEFVAGQSRYSGKIRVELYDALVAICQPGVPVKRAFENDDQISELSVALTRNFEHAVVCLRWSIGAGDRPQAVDRPNIDVQRLTEPDEPRPVAEQPPRVMFVDDDARFLHIVSKVFEQKGWQVETASRARDALERIARLSLDLVVTDLHMPEMDGAMFLQELKEMSDLPVLVLTSDDASEVEAELALLGADSFVRKQEDPRVLLSWCKNLVARKPRALPQTETGGVSGSLASRL